MAHQPVTIKVNAQVDEGIAPLVEALNAIPSIFTVSSCEGGDGEQAYVAFHVGDQWQDIGAFIDRLSAELGHDDTVSDVPFSLSIEWYAGGGTPTGYVKVPHQHVMALASAIRSAELSVSLVTS